MKTNGHGNIMNPLKSNTPLQPVTPDLQNLLGS